MINFLSIKNFALIEDVLLEFSGGLNVLTGETGAGKTIVLDALGLLLGGKAGAQTLRQNAPRLSVAAGFGPLSRRVKKILQELELSVEGDELLVRREVDSSGRSRAFVNDQPVNLSTLARLGEVLVDLHGQHEHQLLLKSAEQRDLLDDFGKLESQRAVVSESYVHWRDLMSEREALSLSVQERQQRIDLYQYQLKELDAANLKPGEDEELELLLPQLKNADKLKTLSGEAYDALNGEDSALDRLLHAKKSLEALVSLGIELNDVSDLLEEARLRVEESAQRLDAIHREVNLDPQRLDEVLSQMDRLSRLKKKYGPELADVIAHQQKIRAELKHLENAEERTQDVDQRLAEAEKKLSADCAALSKARSAAAKKLAETAEKEFKDLGLSRAALEIDVSRHETENAPGRSKKPVYGAHGYDNIEFLFTPNPGEGRKPLAAVASGGELSRVMLALKTVLAKSDPVGTLVFDEIDAGVGGDLGAAIGRKMSRLGKTHQVLCITHLAPIAACGDTHFYVEKEVKSGRTRTVVRKLDEESRIAEVARMLGGAGEKSSARSTSLQHAKALLEELKA